MTSAAIALVLCVIVGMALLFLNKDKAVPTSAAMWLPFLWLGIIGSRPVSVWFASHGPVAGESLDSALEGNSLDALVLSSLLAAGLIVLGYRRESVRAHLKGNWPILFYFTYCLMSVFWSPFPDVAFKRWMRAVGDVVMVAVIVTDAYPVEALRRLFSRLGVILMVGSVYLVRYSDLGRGYDPDGNPMNTGVTTNKNTLGVVALVIGLCTVSTIRGLLSDRNHAARLRRLAAQMSLLALVVTVLSIAHSATSVACFVLGSLVMIVANVKGMRSRPWAIHALLLTAAAMMGSIILLGGQSLFFNALGRDSSLTGRTDIWSTVIPLAMNPIFGAGFESFWNAISGTLRSLPNIYQFGNLNSAHNGYLDIYLNLGLVGVALLVTVLVSTYLRACAAFRHAPELGSLFIAYTLITAIYSITEAGFRVMSPTWMCLLLSAFGATRLRLVCTTANDSTSHHLPMSKAQPDAQWREPLSTVAKARRPNAKLPRRPFARAGVKSL